jgi:hypothetical protein
MVATLGSVLADLCYGVIPQLSASLQKPHGLNLSCPSPFLRATETSATIALRLLPSWWPVEIQENRRGDPAAPSVSRRRQPTGAAGLAAGRYGVDSPLKGRRQKPLTTGFAELLARIADNGVRTIIVETGKPLRPRSHGPGSRLRNAAEPGRDAGCSGQPVILPR